MMKKLFDVNNVFQICVLKEELVVFLSNQSDALPMAKQIVVESFQVAVAFNNLVMYHCDVRPSDLFLLGADDSKRGVIKNVSLSKRNHYKGSGFILDYSRSDSKLFWVNPDSLSVERLAVRRNSWVISNEEFALFEDEGVDFFSIKSQEKKYHVSYADDLGIVPAKPHRSFLYDRFLLVNSKEKLPTFYSLDKKEILWRREEAISRLTFYKDKIYATFQGKNDSGSYSRLEEIDLSSGEVIRSVDISNVKDFKLGFAFTGPHKVYDDYIFFLKSANKNGVFAVFDRKTLSFISYVVLNTYCSPSVDNLHWLDNKLYILDLDKKLHVLEFE